jgi:lipoate-protein ligase B
VRLLGLVDFDAALGLQEWLTFEISGRADTGGVLLLCEHPPLVSIGREGSRGQVLALEEDLKACEMTVRWISRSGGAVVHMPGQLAAYLLLPLDRLGLGLAEYRRRFETALLNVCHELRVPAKRLDSGRGLWTRGGQVGHFGAAVKSWVTQHGMWLNVSPAPGFLRMVRSEAACTGGHELLEENNGNVQRSAPVRSIAEERVTSLQDQLLRRVTMHAAREATMRHVAAAFGYDEVHPFTGHPQLTRTRQRVCITA